MAGYIGSKSSVTLVDGYTEAEADAEFVNDPSSVITVSGSNVGIGTSSPEGKLHVYSDNVGTPSADADDFIIEKTGDTGLSILSTSTGRIYFGDVASNDQGSIRYVHGDNSMRFETDSAERMRIDSSGNVGIGVSPTFSAGGSRRLLQLTNGASGGQIAMGNNANESENPRIFSDADNLGFATATTGGGVFQFYTGGSESMRIDSSGDVAIGTNNPTRHGQTTKTLIYNGSTTTSDFALHVGRLTTGAENQICISNGYGKVGSVTTSGTSTSYNTSSDYRLKENLVDLTGASARVNQLNPLRFNWITDDTDTTVDGFLAHEVADVVPEAITGTKDAMMDEEYEVTPAVLDDDGNVTTEAVMGTRSVPDYQGIDQSKLVPLLTAALQEALTEIASLKTRVEALEA